MICLDFARLAIICKWGFMLIFLICLWLLLAVMSNISYIIVTLIGPIFRFFYELFSSLWNEGTDISEEEKKIYFKD